MKCASIAFLFTTTLFASLFMTENASSQPGTVLSFQKISDTQGNFNHVVDNMDELGGAVAYLGDLDGAGPSAFALAIGAPADDDGGSGRGAIYILFLDANRNILSSQKISSTTGGLSPLVTADEFGSSIARLGDLDGAGGSAMAIAVGAPGDDNGGSARGAVYILYLNSNGTVMSQRKISSTQGYSGQLDDLDEFGGALAWLGDLDGAGPSVCTIAVGTPKDDDGGSDRGAVHVLFLDATGGVLTSQKISQTAGSFIGTLVNFDYLGNSVASLGDLDGAGPGVGALAAGSQGSDLGGSSRGCVYVFILNASGHAISQTRIGTGVGGFLGLLDNLDEFGGAVTNLGDLDGGGPSATVLAVGAGGDDDGGTARGAVHLLFLDNLGVVLSQRKISATTVNFTSALDDEDEFGTAIALIGEPDAPSVTDRTLLAGSINDDDGGEDRGAAYIITVAGLATAGIADVSFTRTHSLGNAWPNPFSPRTRIPFRLGARAAVAIDVCDLQGRRVRRLVRGTLGAGEHHATWDGLDDHGRRLPAGMFLARMTLGAESIVSTRKLVRIE